MDRSKAPRKASRNSTADAGRFMITCWKGAQPAAPRGIHAAGLAAAAGDAAAPVHTSALGCRRLQPTRVGNAGCMQSAHAMTQSAQHRRLHGEYSGFARYVEANFQNLIDLDALDVTPLVAASSAVTDGPPHICLMKWRPSMLNTCTLAVTCGKWVIQEVMWSHGKTIEEMCGAALPSTQPPRAILVTLANRYIARQMPDYIKPYLSLDLAQHALHRSTQHTLQCSPYTSGRHTLFSCVFFFRKWKLSGFRSLAYTCTNMRISYVVENGIASQENAI